MAISSTQMKSITRLSLFLPMPVLVSLSIFGQKRKNKDSKIPASGSVDKADLEMKECDFDKNDEAIVLFETLKGMYLFRTLITGTKLS